MPTENCKMKNFYTRAAYSLSAATHKQLPPDTGIEVAFVGRSNAGKSSAINTLTCNKHLAKTSKAPGRTQTINFFTLDDERSLVDLPGYGFASVTRQTKEQWQQTLSDFLETRKALKGIILLMDIRHPLQPLDQQLLNWILPTGRPIHILLTKTDKLSKSQANKTLMDVQKQVSALSTNISVQLFSSLNKQGLEQLIELLNDWFGLKTLD